MAPCEPVRHGYVGVGCGDYHNRRSSTCTLSCVFRTVLVKTVAVIVGIAFEMSHNLLIFEGLALVNMGSAVFVNRRTATFISQLSSAGRVHHYLAHLGAYGTGGFLPSWSAYGMC